MKFLVTYTGFLKDEVELWGYKIYSEDEFNEEDIKEAILKQDGEMYRLKDGNSIEMSFEDFQVKKIDENQHNHIISIFGGISCGHFPELFSSGEICF
ncbi:MAG: hypothetical protein M0P71_00995 [Melioribacteraceae bacterium]|nr:hypothetical protein [Melioribacteraceae bacterium]